MTRIIVTNDDGVDAPGILALATAMRHLGEVEVIAPATNQSASGHKKTLFNDLIVHKTMLADGITPATAVGGSPADCIALAALGMTQWPPRLVVSGINRGANMGQDVTYSGTVTAALESVIHGVPAIAISLDDWFAESLDQYAEAVRVTQAVVARALVKSMPPLTILNINIPVGAVKGIRLTRQGLRLYNDQLAIDGDRYRIVGTKPGGNIDEEGTDLWAVNLGYASVTPIHLDLTAHRFLADLAAWELPNDGDLPTAQ